LITYFLSSWVNPMLEMNRWILNILWLLLFGIGVLFIEKRFKTTDIHGN
jgi:hypothetical protein